MVLATTWTAARVADRLIEAFRRLPSHPCFSAGGRFVVPDAVDSARDALDWPRRYVDDPRARSVVLTWARCLAMGDSVRERFRDLGWSRTRAERDRRRALSAIAEALNALQIPRIPA